MKKKLNSLDNDETNSISTTDDKSVHDNLLNSMNIFQNNSTERLILQIKRAYYMNEIQKIESFLDSLKNIKRENLKVNELKKLSLYFNQLSNFESLYISLEDYYKGLILQKRIISMLKKNIINKII